MSKPNDKPAAGGGGGGDHGHAQAPKSTPSKGGSVSVLPGQCMAEDCKKRSEKANFCMEHFDWFKEGLITKEGRKPVDFDRKFQAYSRRKKSA